jgi:undecaprenyl diphosphate synthase
MNPVKHVAIIMDGNGRWGIKHKNSRNAGHRAGLYTVESVIDECLKINIKYLTLYTFSTENWKRPKKEINYLFNLLENFLTNKIDNLLKKNIKLKLSNHSDTHFRDQIYIFIKEIYYVKSKKNKI